MAAVLPRGRSTLIQHVAGEATFNAGVKCCLSIDVRFHTSRVARRYGNIPQSEQNEQRKMPQKNGHRDFSQSNDVRFFSICDCAGVVLLLRAETLFAETTQGSVVVAPIHANKKWCRHGRMRRRTLVLCRNAVKASLDISPALFGIDADDADGADGRAPAFSAQSGSGRGDVDRAGP
jgi:hypothetical protein